MRNFNLLFFAAVSMLLPLAALSQTDIPEIPANTERGYYMSQDSVIHAAYIKKADLSGRAREVVIPLQQAHAAARFGPGDILQYGIHASERYVSATIPLYGNERTVFLTELVNMDDQTRVFAYRGGPTDFFFLTRDGNKTFEPLDPNDPQRLWDIYAAANDCPGQIRNLPSKLTADNIQVYYDAYNACNRNLSPRRFIWGPTVGAGMGKPMTSGGLDYTYKIGAAFSAGLFAQFSFDECASLRGEVVFSRLNTTGEDQDPLTAGTSSPDYTRNSLQIPLLLRYSFNYIPRRTIPYLEVGPAFDILLGGDKYSGPIEYDPGFTEDYSLTNFQYGLAAGAGITYKLSEKHALGIGLRYTWLTGSRGGYYTEKINYLQLNVSFSL